MVGASSWHGLHSTTSKISSSTQPEDHPAASLHLHTLIRWLTDRAGDRGLSALKALHIQDTHFDVHAVLCFVERRAAVGRPLDGLHLHLEDDSDSLTDEARLYFQSWRDCTVATLSCHVKLEFHENNCCPQITPPPVCTAPVD